MARFVKTLLGALTAASVLAQPLRAEEQALRSPEVKAFVEALISMDCTLTEATAEQLMEKAGLDSEDAMGAMTTLMIAEVVEEADGDKVILKDPYCKGGFAALPEDKDTPLAMQDADEAEDEAENEQALIAAIEKLGCKFDRSQGEEVLSEIDLDPETAEDTVRSLIKKDVLVVEGDTLVLKTEGCK